MRRSRQQTSERADAGPLVVNGWTIFAHPLFISQLDALERDVERLRRKHPRAYLKKNATKRLAAILKLALEVIPADPARPEYRQGGALGTDRRHWFRAKFFQQYRLFFRYHAASRVIVYAWVNDFRRMLETGDPPDGWDELLRAARGLQSRRPATGTVGRS